jgi:hypothetical protein
MCANNLNSICKGCGVRVSGFGFRGSGLGIQGVSGFGVEASGDPARSLCQQCWEVRGWGFRLHVAGFGVGD